MLDWNQAIKGHELSTQTTLPEKGTNTTPDFVCVLAGMRGNKKGHLKAALKCSKPQKNEA